MAGYMPKKRPVPAAKMSAFTTTLGVTTAGIARERGDARGEELADEDAEESAEDGDQQRLGQQLQEDLRRRGADGLACADLRARAH